MRKILLFVSFLFVAACSNNNSGNYSGPQPELVNDPKVLSERVNLVNQSLLFTFTDVITSSSPDYTHLVSITPPVVGGQPLRATATLKLDNYLVISYNREGAAVSGGIDIVDISHLESPVLLASLTTNSYDINDMKSKGRALYLVGEKAGGVGAVMLTVDIANITNPVIVNEYVLQGQSATSVDVRNDRIFVSTAQNGGISRFEVSYLDVLAPTFLRYNAFPNALFVKAMISGSSENDAIEPMVLGGSSDTHLYFLDKELPVAASASTSPSRMTVMGPMVYMNSTSGGVTVSEISNILSGRPFEGFVRSVSLPGTATGIAQLDQKLYVTRGESGVRVVNVEEPGAPVETGFFKFGDFGSANNVWVERYSSTFKVITVADGAGGVRLVKEDLSKLSSEADGSIIKVYAKGTPLAGVGPIMRVLVNGVQVGADVEVLTNTWSNYYFQASSAIPFGADVRVLFINDAYSTGVDDRNLSIGYVKIGEDHFYQWWNNYYDMNNVLFSSFDSNNLAMFSNGYLKFSR